MINYDISQNPPAPMLQVTISGVRRTFPHRTMPALLDTGGDVTAIPRALVNTLRLYTVGRIQIEGVEGIWTKLSSIIQYPILANEITN